MEIKNKSVDPSVGAAFMIANGNIAIEELAYKAIVHFGLEG